MQRVRVHLGDITRLEVDAIVNAANERLLGGGGVDGAIHRASGPRLLAACRSLPEVRPGVRCPTGMAVLTPGFSLPARFVIHTVGPVWAGGQRGEAQQLANCYKTSLELAHARGLKSVAFPAISCGIYGFPVAEAQRIAVSEVRRFLRSAPKFERILLVAFDATVAEQLQAALAALPADG